MAVCGWVLGVNPKLSGYMVTMSTLVVALLTCNPKLSGYTMHPPTHRQREVGAGLAVY